MQPEQTMGNRLFLSDKPMNQLTLSQTSTHPCAPSCDQIKGDHLFFRKYQIWLFERMLSEKTAIKFKETHLIEVKALIEMKKLLALNPELHDECLYYFGSDLAPRKK